MSACTLDVRRVTFDAWVRYSRLSRFKAIAGNINLALFERCALDGLGRRQRTKVIQERIQKHLEAQVDVESEKTIVFNDNQVLTKVRPLSESKNLETKTVNSNLFKISEREGKRQESIKRRSEKLKENSQQNNCITKYNQHSKNFYRKTNNVSNSDKALLDSMAQRAMSRKEKRLELNILYEKKLNEHQQMKQEDALSSLYEKLIKKRIYLQRKKCLEQQRKEAVEKEAQLMLLAIQFHSKNTCIRHILNPWKTFIAVQRKKEVNAIESYISHLKRKVWSHWKQYTNTQCKYNLLNKYWKRFVSYHLLTTERNKKFLRFYRKLILFKYFASIYFYHLHVLNIKMLTQRVYNCLVKRKYFEYLCVYVEKQEEIYYHEKEKQKLRDKVKVWLHEMESKKG